MAKKPRIKQSITDASKALKKIMQENLAEIAKEMIAQIMVGYRNLPESQRFNAIKDVAPKGINAYKSALKNAVSVVAYEALKDVRKEIPSKRNVRLAFDEDSLKLGEFESLPADIQKRILAQVNLLTGTQISDLEKRVYFQYTSSVDSTDSETLIQSDLSESAEDYIGGQSVNGGADATASQTINEARLAFFTDDSVEEEIEAYEFVNEDPVSQICTDLAGTVFAKDDPDLYRYWPPLHFNCKSWIRAILKGNIGNKTISDLKDSVTKKGESSIGFSEIDADNLFRPGSRLLFQIMKKHDNSKDHFMCGEFKIKK